MNQMTRNDLSEEEKDEIMKDMIRALELDPETMNPLETNMLRPLTVV